MLQFSNINRINPEAQNAKMSLTYLPEHDYAFTFWNCPEMQATFLVKDNNKWVCVKQGDTITNDSLTTFVCKYGFNSDLYNADANYDYRQSRPNVTAFPAVQGQEKSQAVAA